MKGEQAAGGGRNRLTAEQRILVHWTLRTPRGHYPVSRASQLSGVPQRTLYDWASHRVLVPDFPRRPQAWSYRDLIFARLVAWLRTKSMPRPEVVQRVNEVRGQLEASPDFDALRSDGRGLFLGDLTVDHLTGQGAIPAVLVFLDEFDLTATVDMSEFGRTHLWGPNLLTPSARSYISPRVMGGEPCVLDTRIPTGSLYALRTERGLDPPAIRALYEELEQSDIEDAIQLESRLRRQAA